MLQKKHAFWCKIDQNRKKNKEIWRYQSCFYGCRYFEYLMRMYDVIKP